MNPAHSGITFEGQPHLTLGGVGRNLATAIQFLGHKPIFITSLADDKLGSFALRELQDIGFSSSSGGGGVKDQEQGKVCINKFIGATSSSSAPPASSCFALVLMDSIGGQCEYVVANLEAAQAIDCKAIELNFKLIQQAPLLVMDANLMSTTMEFILKLCHKIQLPIFLEPTDVMALPRLVDCLKRIQTNQAECLGSLLCLSPNLVELIRMIELFEGSAGNDMSDNLGKLTLDEIREMIGRLMNVHLPQLKCLLVTMDKRGVLVGVRTGNDTREDLKGIRLMREDDEGDRKSSTLVVKEFRPPRLVEKPVSASGAGDSFAAGFISGLLRDLNLIECLDRGFKASLLTLNDRDNVSIKLREM